MPLRWLGWGGAKAKVKEVGLAWILTGGRVGNLLIGKGLGSAGGVGAGQHGQSGNHSQVPPTKSRCPIPYTPHLVGPRKNGGGPGEGQKKIANRAAPRRRVDGPQGGAEGMFRVLRVLLASRYPRSAQAIAASAGVSRATGYRALAKIEVSSGLPVTTETVLDPYTWKPVMLWGIDWARLRGMG